MGRSYQDWINTQDQAVVAKIRAGDEANKPLLNQINWLWVKNLMDKKNGIALVSYQGEGTPGRKLLETGKVESRGRDMNVSAEIKQFEFSGHSDRNALFDLVKNIKGDPEVLTVHGDAESCNRFAEEINEKFCQYNPFLGLIPIEISDIYPASHYLQAELNCDPIDFPIFFKTWEIFFKKNNFSKIYYNKDDQFLKFFVNKLSKKIQKKSLNTEK